MLILKILKFISNKAATMFANKKAAKITELSDLVKIREDKLASRIKSDNKVLELLIQAHADSQKLDAEKHTNYLKEVAEQTKLLNNL